MSLWSGPKVSLRFSTIMRTTAHADARYSTGWRSPRRSWSRSGDYTRIWFVEGNREISDPDGRIATDHDPLHDAV